MNVTFTQNSTGVFSAAQRSNSAPAAEKPAQQPTESFEKSQADEAEPNRLCSAAKGAAYGFGISTAVGLGLSVATFGAMLPVAIVAVPVCTALGAYVGAVNPKFET